LSVTDNHIKADLHTHTNYSDGFYSPAELVKKAKDAGLSYIAVTDHDNVDAVEEAIHCGKELGIEVIPGAEISADYNGREVHILAYFFDYKNAELLDCLVKFRLERKKRADAIVQKLNELNIPLKIEDVMSNVKGNGSIGRPHIAAALVDHNYIDTYHNAFNKLLGEGKDAYVKKPNIEAHEAIKLITRSGGLSFVAHPGKNIRENMLIELIEFGLDGIEVLHPSHNANDITYFQNITGQYFLLESGGSDFHGGRINDDSILGSYWISEQKITAMKNRLFIT
jgi:predicted metal-dependent phosphoesterase TrpH